MSHIHLYVRFFNVYLKAVLPNQASRFVFLLVVLHVLALKVLDALVDIHELIKMLYWEFFRLNSVGSYLDRMVYYLRE